MFKNIEAEVVSVMTVTNPRIQCFDSIDKIQTVNTSVRTPVIVQMEHMFTGLNIEEESYKQHLYRIRQ